MELERKDLVSENNLNLLENIIKQVCPMLVEKIYRFQAQNCKLEKLKRHP